MEEGVEQSGAGLGTEASKDSDNSQLTSGKGVVNGTSAMYGQNNPTRTPPQRGVGAMFLHKFRDAKFGVSTVRWVFWGAAFVFTAAVSATVGATVALMTPLSPLIAPQHQGNEQKGDLSHFDFQYRLARPVNILVMGIDRVLNVPDNSPKKFTGNSDTMLLLRLDSTARSVNMLSIPRDTRVEIPGAGMDKINNANVTGGASLAARVVSRTLNNVPIDRYVRITTGAFRELVDLVGGVEVFVPYPMNYVDKTQNLNIHLDQGWQTLNGDQAEQFARFRHDQYGDIGRVQRQQALLKALRQRLQTPAVLPRLPQMIQVMEKYVDTNLSLEEMLALVNFGLGLNQDDFKMVLLPGRFSTPGEYAASYWIMDTVAKDRIAREYFDRSSIKASSGVSRSPSELRIAIQNASSQPELSQRVADDLKRKGFSYVYIVKDWPDPQRQTEIIVEQGDTKAAIALKKVLGKGKVEAASTGDIRSDLTIRLGEDSIVSK